jgi:hypothetical protein
MNGGHIRRKMFKRLEQAALFWYKYCNGPLPLNGRLVTDVISAVTGNDSYPNTGNG